MPTPVAAAPAEAEAVRPDTSGLEFDNEITLEGSPDYIVKGILHQGDTAELYGSSGVGKTFAALDMGYAIARGQPWHGRKVQKGAVLYVGLEGNRALQKRMRACAQEHGSAGRMLARLTLHTPLDKSEAGAAGAQGIIEHARKLEVASGSRVVLVVLDTLARAMAGDDENSAGDMAAFIEKRVGEIARATGAAVLIVHHPGKDDARGMRGSTALFAACDTVIKIAPGDGGIRNVSIEKAKDGEAGPLLAYRLRQVQLGTDEEGDPITSCVVEADEATAAATAKPKKRLNPTAERALEMLGRLYSEGKARDIEPEAINLAGVAERDRPKVVTLDEFRAKCYEAKLSPEGKQAAQRQAFNRALKDLEAANKIGRYDEYVWLIGQQRGEASPKPAIPERDTNNKRDKPRDMSRAGGQRDTRDSPPIGGVTDVTLSPGQPEEEEKAIPFAGEDRSRGVAAQPVNTAPALKSIPRNVEDRRR